MFLVTITLLWCSLGLATPPNYQVWLGENVGCAVDDNGFHCWGSNENGQVINNPRLGNTQQLGIGNKHICALDEKGVVCWGLNDKGQTDVPPLENPKQLSVQGDSTCAIDQKGLQCWGFIQGRSFGEPRAGDSVKFPKLQNPKAMQLTYSVERTYDTTQGLRVKDDYGFSCWDSYRKQHIFEPIKMNTIDRDLLFDKAVGVAYSLTGSGYVRSQFSCPDSPPDKQEEYILFVDLAKSTEKPKQVVFGKVLGFVQFCTRNNLGVTCFYGGSGTDKIEYSDHTSKLAGKPWSIKPVEIPPLNKPRKISSSLNQYCALDDNGVTCWNSFDEKNDLILPKPALIKVPPLNQPIDLLSNQGTTCAVEVSGLTCWSAPGTDEKAGVPRLLTTKDVSFVWYQTESFLKNMTATNPPNRGRYFADITAFYQQALGGGYDIEFQWFVMNLLQPAIASVDSEYFQTQVLPQYARMMKLMQADLAKKKLKIVDSQLYRRAALMSLKSALQIASEFLGPEDRQQLITVVKSAEQALADPSNQLILQVLKNIESMQPSLMPLGQSKKTDFILPVIANSMQPLKEWVQH